MIYSIGLKKVSPHPSLSLFLCHSSTFLLSAKTTNSISVKIVYPVNRNVNATRKSTSYIYNRYKKVKLVFKPELD
jgi:hypothetical protein